MNKKTENENQAPEDRFDGNDEGSKDEHELTVEKHNEGIEEQDDEDLLLSVISSPFPEIPAQHELPLEGLLSRSICEWKKDKLL